jgi:hypothetical protein
MERLKKRRNERNEIGEKKAKRAERKKRELCCCAIDTRIKLPLTGQVGDWDDSVVRQTGRGRRRGVKCT